jgi:NTE family protein
MAKTALVLGGGGSLGAFSVGAVRYLMVDKGIRPDIVTGTSTGALAAVLAASGEPALLTDIYTNVETADVLHRSFLGDAGVIAHGYLNSVEPLKELIETYLTDARLDRIRTRNVELSVAVTNLQSGKVEYGTESQSIEALRRLVLASTCQPILMPTIALGGHDYLDGGIMQMLPIDRAIHLGATKVYAIATMPAPSDRAPITRRFPNTPGTDVLNYTLRRAVWLLATQQTDDAIALARARGVDLTAIRPARNLTSDPLEFDRAEMTAMVDEGYRRAKALLP